tara:strand:- start:1072 stop:1212 length:141 start_codon:yes stop_codon:yes gene_type:complete
MRILCQRCKIALTKTELKNVYQCPMCKVVIGEKTELPRDQTIIEEE